MTGPETKEQRAGTSITRTYTWRLPVASLPELEISYNVSVREEQVLGESIEEKLPEALFREKEMFGKFGFRLNQQRVAGLNAISIILYWLVFAVVLILGIYRFIQRARQRELSYKRITILTISLAILFLVVILITDIATYDQALMRSTSLLPIYIVGTISYLFMGFVCRDCVRQRRRRSAGGLSRKTNFARRVAYGKTVFAQRGKRGCSRRCDWWLGLSAA